MSKKSSNFGLRHYVSPEITVAKSSKWQNKIHFTCTFGFFVVILQAKLQVLFERMRAENEKGGDKEGQKTKKRAETLFL